MTEEQRRPPPVTTQPEGLLDLWRCSGVTRRSKTHKDILSPRALPQRQISGNAPVPIHEMGYKKARSLKLLGCFRHQSRIRFR